MIWIVAHDRACDLTSQALIPPTVGAEPDQGSEEMGARLIVRSWPAVAQMTGWRYWTGSAIALPWDKPTR